MPTFFYCVGLSSCLLFQVFLELLLSSDIPVAITNHELYFFVTYSFLLVAIYLLWFKMFPGISKWNIILISAVFLCFWLLSLKNMFLLLEIPSSLLIMNIVGVITPLTLLMASLIKRKKGL